MSTPAPPPTKILTAQQLLQIARDAGFPPHVDVTMGAIARRESGGDPTVHNGDALTGDDSWGLFQINLRDNGVRALLAAHGITTGEQLQDPATNAKAAWLLWGGKNKNLSVAWYIDKPGYRQRYEVHLPEMQTAALGM